MRSVSGSLGAVGDSSSGAKARSAPKAPIKGFGCSRGCNGTRAPSRGPRGGDPAAAGRMRVRPPSSPSPKGSSREAI